MVLTKHVGLRVVANMGIRGAAALAIAAALLVGTGVHAAPRPAPAFEIALLDGKTFRLADHKTTAVVLLFWAPW